MPTRRSIVERFWEKVDKDGPVPFHLPELGQCWQWTGAVTRAHWRYGILSRGGHSGSDGFITTHRLSWEIHNGPIVGDLCVLHRCDNPSCVRPEHLFLGTNQDNNADKVAKGRQRGPEKLTAEQVAEIRAMRAAGWLGKDIAEHFGVVPSTIVHIAKGRTWNR